MISVNYVGCNAVEDNYTQVLRPNGSGDCLFICFLTPMHICLPDQIEVARPGACILYTPGIVQEYSAIRDFRISFVHFSVPKAELEKFDLPLNEVFYPEDIEEIGRLLYDLQTEYFTQNVYCEEAMDALARQILITIAREQDAEKIQEENERKLYNLFCQARYTILSNCEKEWASTNMSQMVSLSRSQFYKYYNDFFGVSPMADLQEARIEKAKFLLTNDRLQVTEVAKRCGYASIHHFSRTFKEHCGMSPLAYVKEITGQD